MTPVGVWRVCDELGGEDRGQPVPGGVPRRLRAPALQGVREEGRRKIWLAAVTPTGPAGCGSTRAVGRCRSGTGRRPGSPPARSADHQRGRPRPVPQPPQAGVRGPAAQGPDADADPDVGRRTVRPPGARHGAARARAAVHDAARRGRGGPAVVAPLPQDGDPPGAALRRGVLVVRAAADAAGRVRPVLPLPGAGPSGGGTCSRACRAWRRTT